MNRLERIGACNFIEINEEIFFSNCFYNGLFKVESKTGKTTFLGHFENEKLTERNIHLELFLKGRKIYFLPRRGHHIHIYDLDYYFIESIEIKKKSERFYIIENIMLENNNLIFFPFKENFPIKKFDLNTLKIKDVDYGLEFKKEFILEKKNDFPAPELIEKYNIKLPDFFLCKKMSNGKWCGFLPTGRQMLWYREGEDEFEVIPLAVTNQIKLNKYLDKVKQEIMKEPFHESEQINIMWMMNEQKIIGKTIGKNFSAVCLGKKIWKSVVKK